ncbi:hypothetical protein MP638_000994 [Amoeboaphelidium occidentale]|nr:hypothetical protein MP638_000994 [Amoeboaphelidium occidentale]
MHSEFIRFCIENQVLLFGDFTLKSKRKSPYFFNAGLFRTGKAMSLLGRFYAKKIYASCCTDGKPNFDILFGPAYKGIPLVAAIAIAFYELYEVDLPFAYNRKEAKDHGEGGVLVGAPLQGKVLVVDDVITAGTAIRETMKLIEATENASLYGVCVCLDRKEAGQNANNLSAIQEIERDYGAKVHSIINIDNIVNYLKEEGRTDEAAKISAYRQQYII